MNLKKIIYFIYKNNFYLCFMDIINILQKCFIEISDLIRFTDSSELGELMDLENKSGDVIKKL